jgi:hypothetical protein
MSRNERSADTLRHRRELEKNRRSKKCELNEEVHGEMFKLLDETPHGEKPKFADIARYVACCLYHLVTSSSHSKLLNAYDLDCSLDWLREVVRTKFQHWSGEGARRRAQRPSPPMEPTNVREPDPDILEEAAQVGLSTFSDLDFSLLQANCARDTCH